MNLRSTYSTLIFAAAATIVQPAFSAETTRKFATSDSSKQRIVIIDQNGVWRFQDFKRFGNALTNSQILFE